MTKTEAEGEQFRRPDTRTKPRFGLDCISCHRELELHERPQKGLPGLCTDCARAASAT